MSKPSDISLSQNDLIVQCYDLRIQYNELLRLRAELASLLSRSKTSPLRKHLIRPRDRSVKPDERPASRAPILLLVS